MDSVKNYWATGMLRPWGNFWPAGWGHIIRYSYAENATHCAQVHFSLRSTFTHVISNCCLSYLAKWVSQPWLHRQGGADRSLYRQTSSQGATQVFCPQGHCQAWGYKLHISAVLSACKNPLLLQGIKPRASCRQDKWSLRSYNTN